VIDPKKYRWHVEERPHKDGTKSYRLKVELPLDPITGTRQTRTGTFRTKKEAEKEAVAWVSETDNGIAVKPSKLTLADVCAQWLDLRRPDLKVELTRFGGHRIIGQSMLNRRCPDATHPSGLPAGV